MDKQLNPCPFCKGNKVGLIKETNKYRVICVNPSCHIEPYTNWQDTKQEAIEAWNRRVSNG